MIKINDAGHGPSEPAPRATAKSGAGAARRLAWALAVGILGGCVTVEAPDEPIVIQLDLNIKQEVVYRLAENAGSTIEQNPEIF